MSAISDAIFNPAALYETKWEEFFVVTARADAPAAAPRWRPAVNAYRCSDHFIVFADLAGVPADSIQVHAEAGRLTLRGRRPAPEPACSRSELGQLLALEIDQGAFERTLDLPQEIDPAGVTTEYRDGVLQVRLPILA
ncbi:MAG TPA: Hsp20/alpha crystallin family protein [Lacunisphaera sp.]|nr:Hsp20/alpha crystallin family protein [Lacunisphaera sp.]